MKYCSDNKGNITELFWDVQGIRHLTAKSSCSMSIICLRLTRTSLASKYLIGGQKDICPYELYITTTTPSSTGIQGSSSKPIRDIKSVWTVKIKMLSPKFQELGDSQNDVMNTLHDHGMALNLHFINSCQKGTFMTSFTSMKKI